MPFSASSTTFIVRCSTSVRLPLKWNIRRRTCSWAVRDEPREPAPFARGRGVTRSGTRRATPAFSRARTRARSRTGGLDCRADNGSPIREGWFSKPLGCGDGRGLRRERSGCRGCLRNWQPSTASERRLTTGTGRACRCRSGRTDPPGSGDTTDSGGAGCGSERRASSAVGSAHRSVSVSTE